MTTAATSPAPPVGRPHAKLLLALALGALAIGIALAGVRAVGLIHSFQRLHALRSGSAPADTRAIPDWMPLGSIARHHQVPEPVLEDALRAAGFTVAPQEARPGFPGLFGGRGERPLAPDGADRRATQGRAPLPPARQSPRQIAERSGRPPAEAVAVLREAIRDYRASHAPPARVPAQVSGVRAGRGRDDSPQPGRPSADLPGSGR